MTLSFKKNICHTIFTSVDPPFLIPGFANLYFAWCTKFSSEDISSFSGKMGPQVLFCFSIL